MSRVDVARSTFYCNDRQKMKIPSFHIPVNIPPHLLPDEYHLAHTHLNLQIHTLRSGIHTLQAHRALRIQIQLRTNAANTVLQMSK